MGDAQNAKNPAPVPLTPDQIREQLDTIARIFEECSDMNRRPANPANAVAPPVNAVAPPVNAVAPPVNGNNPNAAGSASIEPSDDVNGVADPANDVIQSNGVAHPVKNENKKKNNKKKNVIQANGAAEPVNGNNSNAVDSAAIKPSEVVGQSIKNEVTQANGVAKSAKIDVIKTNGMVHPANGVKPSDDEAQPAKSNGVAQPVNGNNPNAVDSTAIKPSEVVGQSVKSDVIQTNGVAKSAKIDVIKTNGMVHPANGVKPSDDEAQPAKSNGVAQPVNGNNPNAVDSTAIKPSEVVGQSVKSDVIQTNGVAKSAKIDVIKTNGMVHPANGVKSSDDVTDPVKNGVAEPVNGNNPNAVGSAVESSDVAAQSIQNDVIQTNGVAQLANNGNKKKKNVIKTNGMAHPANGVKSSDNVADPVRNGVAEPVNGSNSNAVSSAIIQPSDVVAQPGMNGVAETANDVIQANGGAPPVNNGNKKKNKKKKNVIQVNGVAEPVKNDVINANGVAEPVNGDNPNAVGSAVTESSNDVAPVKNGNKKQKNVIKTNGVAHPANGVKPSDDVAQPAKSDGVAEPVNGNNPNAVDGAVMQPSDDMAQPVNNGVAESSNGVDVENDVIQPSDAVASVKKGKKKRNRKKKNVNPANGVAQPVNNGVGLPANAVIVNNEVVRIPPALLADLANPEGTEFHDTSCRTYVADCVLHVNPPIEYVGLPDPKEESKDPYILVSYLNEKEHLPHIESLMRATLSEPYHIYTYRYFTHHFPDLCHLAFERETGECVGVVLARVEEKRPKVDKKAEEKTDKNGNEDNSIEEKPLVDLNAEILVGYGYIGMLAVVPKMRRMGLASRLVRTVLDVMMVKYKCPGAYLDTEVCNEAALRFYAKFGFIKSTYFYKYYLNHNDAYRLLLLFTPTDYKDVLGKLPSLRKAVDPCHHPVIKSHVSSDHLVKYCQPTQLYLRYKPSEGHRIQRPPSYPAYQQLPVAPPEPDLDDELVEEMNREREQATIPEEELNEVLEEPQPVVEEREPTPEPVLTRNQRNKQMRRQRKAQRENGEGTSQEGTSQDESQEDASQESQEEASQEESQEETSQESQEEAKTEDSAEE